MIFGILPGVFYREIRAGSRGFVLVVRGILPSFEDDFCQAERFSLVLPPHRQGFGLELDSDDRYRSQGFRFTVRWIRSAAV
jgi:hypothetical protein